MSSAAGSAPAAGAAITAVGVVVPARDEAERIEACLSGVLAALAALPDTTARAVCVVLDRCTDDTATRAARAVAAFGHRASRVPRGDATVVDLLRNDAPTTIGTLRDRGLRRVLARLRPAPLARTWLLSTDADTTVGPTWVLDHLRHADAGADVVAGLADLDDPRRLPPDVLRRYRRVVAAGLQGLGHTHVYAANLGVRASGYAAVGGFPAVAVGEEHALLARLRAAGYALVNPVDVRVRTSARLSGRAEGGLADLLQSLHAVRCTPAPGGGSGATARPGGVP